MMAYDNTGKGSLWSNKYWREGEKQPKWTGKLYADRDIKAGEEIPLAMWPNERKSENSPVLRLQVDRWKEQNAKAQKQDAVNQPAAENPFDDTLPF